MVSAKLSAEPQLFALGPSVNLLSTECTANGTPEELQWAHDLEVSVWQIEDMSMS